MMLNQDGFYKKIHGKEGGPCPFNAIVKYDSINNVE